MHLRNDLEAEEKSSNSKLQQALERYGAFGTAAQRFRIANEALNTLLLNDINKNNIKDYMTSTIEELLLSNLSAKQLYEVLSANQELLEDLFDYPDLITIFIDKIGGTEAQAYSLFWIIETARHPIDDDVRYPLSGHYLLELCRQNSLLGELVLSLAATKLANSVISRLEEMRKPQPKVTHVNSRFL